MTKEAATNRMPGPLQKHTRQEYRIQEEGGKAGQSGVAGDALSGSLRGHRDGPGQYGGVNKAELCKTRYIQ